MGENIPDKSTPEKTTPPTENKICVICTEDTCVPVMELLNAISKLGNGSTPTEAQGDKKVE